MILNYVDKKIKEDLLKELYECKTSKEMNEVFDKFDDYLNRLMFANRYEDIFLLKIHILNNFMNEPTINYSPYDEITPKIVYELTKNTFLKERKKDKLKNIKNNLEFSMPKEKLSVTIKIRDPIEMDDNTKIIINRFLNNCKTIEEIDDVFNKKEFIKYFPKNFIDLRTKYLHSINNNLIFSYINDITYTEEEKYEFSKINFIMNKTQNNDKYKLQKLYETSISNFIFENKFKDIIKNFDSKVNSLNIIKSIDKKNKLVIEFTCLIINDMMPLFLYPINKEKAIKIIKNNLDLSSIKLKCKNVFDLKYKTKYNITESIEVYFKVVAKQM